MSPILNRLTIYHWGLSGMCLSRGTRFYTEVGALIHENYQFKREMDHLGGIGSLGIPLKSHYRDEDNSLIKL